MKQYGSVTGSIPCPFCGNPVSVAISWDDGYNKHGTGTGLPPSFSTEPEEVCPCFNNDDQEKMERWHRKIAQLAILEQKFNERRLKLEEQMYDADYYRNEEEVEEISEAMAELEDDYERERDEIMEFNTQEVGLA